MTYTLARIQDDMVLSRAQWVLSDGTKTVHTWYFAPLWWVRASCLLHGWGWPKVNR